MNSISFILFAAVYAAISIALMSVPAVCGFFIFCTGASFIKAFRLPESKPVHRPAMQYAR